LNTPSNARAMPLSPGLGAALEVLGGLTTTLLLSACCKAACLSLLPPSFAPAAQLAGVLLALPLVYGTRLRPRAPPLRAFLRVAAAFARTLDPRRALSGPGALPLLFHAGALMLLLRRAGGGGGDWRGAAARLAECATPTALLWAPLQEEAMFRGTLFYVALHRSGGDAALAGGLAAAAFAAVHLPNAAAPGAAAAYVGLQAVAAICAGATYTALFALRGSLAEVALLHAANNAVAVAWLAGAGTGSCALAAAPPAGERAALGMALLGAQVAAYAAAALAAVARLRALLARDELAAGGRGAFKRLHGVVYGGEGEEEGEEEAGKLE
jgi:membrane protease YdiL (CAAX protease family)